MRSYFSVIINHRVKELFQWLDASISYSLFFSLKNLFEGKRKEKERKNWRRKWAILRNWFTWRKIKSFIAFWIHSRNSKRKRKEKKQSESDEGTQLVAEPFCFVKPISYYQDRIKRHDETVVKQPRPQGLLSFFQFIGGKPKEEGLLFSAAAILPHEKTLVMRPGSKCNAKHVSHGPWKVLENWKIVGYPWKVLEFSTEVLEYFWKQLE